MTQQTFRSALNGFNREDVVNYIEYLNSVHAAEINQLRSELEFLRNREPVADLAPELDIAALAEQKDMIEQQAFRIRELFDRTQELEAKLAAAEEAKAQAEEKLIAAEEAKTQAEDKLAAADVAKTQAEVKLASVEEARTHAEEKLQAVVLQQNSFQSRVNEELEAYRRAERIERQAKERAELVYQQSNGALAEASIRVEEAATQIGQLSDLVMEQIAQLQNAVFGTKQAMKEASQVLYTIRPQEEK